MFFGVTALILVGASWCLVGIIMGQAPKKSVEPSLVQLGGGIVSLLGGGILMGIIGLGEIRPVVFFFCCGCCVLGGALNCLMLQLMSYAMQRGPNGIIWSIIQSALIFPFLGGVIFFGVQLTLPRGLGIVCVIIALLLFGLGKANRPEMITGNWRLAAFGCLAICAIQQNLMTLPSYFPKARQVPSILRAMSTASGTLMMAFAWQFRHGTGPVRRKLAGNIRNKYLWVYIGGLQFFNLLFAYTLFYPGLDAMAVAGAGGVSYPLLVGSCIISFTLYSRGVLKEHLKPLQYLALTLCLAGLAGLCFPVPSGK